MMFPQFIGSPGYQRGSYTFYKAFKYYKNEKCKILMLGEFFFVKMSSNDDPCIGELQLLWEDRNTDQMLSSIRLYFLPEQTPLGRQPHHGEHEIIAATDKITLRLEDLVSWITNEVDWNHGLRGIYQGLVKSSSPVYLSQFTLVTNGTVIKDGTNVAKSFMGNNSGLDFEDINREKELIGDNKDSSALGIYIITYPKYLRYCAMLQRLGDKVNEWLNNALIVALGGFTVPSHNVYILFCRDYFDHEGLSQNDANCEHLAPIFKGRPRKKKGKYEADYYSEYNMNKIQPKVPKRSLGQIEESFLRNLFAFMKNRNTPIQRVPNLGFKQIDLYMFFCLVQKLGGYEQITHKKQWKVIYDELGGNPGSTSAATCTRRHYERLLLPYERYMNGEEDKPLPPPPPPRMRNKKASSDKEKSELNHEEFFCLCANSEMSQSDKLYDSSSNKDKEFYNHDEYSESTEEQQEWLEKIKDDITYLAENYSSVYAINKNDDSCEDKEKKWNEIRMKNALARNWARQLRPLKVGMKETLEKYQRILKDAMQLHQNHPRTQSNTNDFVNIQANQTESLLKTVTSLMPLLSNTCIISKPFISDESCSFKNHLSNLAISEHAYYLPVEQHNHLSNKLYESSKNDSSGVTTCTGVHPHTVHSAVSLPSSLSCSTDTTCSISTVSSTEQQTVPSSKYGFMLENEKITKSRNNFGIMSPLMHQKNHGWMDMIAPPSGQGVIAHTNEKFSFPEKNLVNTIYSTDNLKNIRYNDKESNCYQIRPSVIHHTEPKQSITLEGKITPTSSFRSDSHNSSVSQLVFSSLSVMPYIESKAEMDESTRLILPMLSKKLSIRVPLNRSVADKTLINSVQHTNSIISDQENINAFHNNRHAQIQDDKHTDSPKFKFETRELHKEFGLQTNQQCSIATQKRSLSMSNICSYTATEEDRTNILPVTDTLIINQEFLKDSFKANTSYFEQAKRVRLNSSPISFSTKCDTMHSNYKMNPLSLSTMEDVNTATVLDLSTKNKSQLRGLDVVMPSSNPPNIPTDGICLDLSVKQKMIGTISSPSNGIENITPPPEEMEPPLYQNSPFVVSKAKTSPHLTSVTSNVGNPEVFSDTALDSILCSDVSSNRISILTSENSTSSIAETSDSPSPSYLPSSIKNTGKNSMIFDYSSSQSLNPLRPPFCLPQSSHYISTEGLQIDLENYKDIVDQDVIIQYRYHIGPHLYPVLYKEGQI